MTTLQEKSDAVSDAPWYRSLWFRWLLLAVAWALALAALPAPAFDVQTGWFPNPLPTFVFFAIMFGIPVFCPLWISLVCFVLTPILMAMPPRGWLLIPLRLMQCALLFPWLLLPYGYWLNLSQPNAGTAHAMWGYYCWATGFTFAFLALILHRDDTPRADRRRGFPVVTGSGNPKGGA